MRCFIFSEKLIKCPTIPQGKEKVTEREYTDFFFILKTQLLYQSTSMIFCEILVNNCALEVLRDVFLNFTETQARWLSPPGSSSGPMGIV